MADSTTLPSTARDLDDPIRHNRIWAVLVAVNTYAHREAKPLRGAVNDSDDFYDLLTITLKVHSSHIVRLSNEEATRTRILDVLFSHLINNSAIERGDTIVFYYAGHGDRRIAPAGWNAVGYPTTVELICPHDEGMPDQAGRPIVGIPSRTFGGLMRRLAHEKGDNIMTVFDCCHSGGMHRGPASAGRTRYLSAESSIPRFPIPEDLDQEIWAWQDPDAGRGVAMVPVVQPDTGFSILEARSHVLLAACAPDQTAQEHIILDKPRGVFTYLLLKRMRMRLGEPDLTYARLMNALRKQDHLGLWGPGAPLPVMVWHLQTPVCLGQNKHRLVFSLDEELEAASTFPIRYDRGILYVGAGCCNNIIKGMQFIVEVPVEMRGSLNLKHLVLTAESVGDVHCTVQCGAYDTVPPEIGVALDGKDAILCTDVTKLPHMRRPSLG
ncbi:caspase domain-containing protein [Fomitopsis serialis]|uniref:caspase domain-containing protein n=1 Tax=Fomitopsis serialis TaxID=139415 RepID=UPI002008A81F|nr:caspase domain-containing protein [Neoantrodia serialis]KAH9931361.1 caspase domain-containing protein [Neoantrodia serialis]